MRGDVMDDITREFIEMAKPINEVLDMSKISGELLKEYRLNADLSEFIAYLSKLMKVDFKLNRKEKFAILRYNGGLTKIKINSSVDGFLREFKMFTDYVPSPTLFGCWSVDEFFNSFVSKKVWSFDEFNNRDELYPLAQSAFVLILDCTLGETSLKDINQLLDDLLDGELKGNYDFYYYILFTESQKPFPHGYIFHTD